MPEKKRYRPERADKLTAIANETLNVLPNVIQSLPRLKPTESELFRSSTNPLTAAACPNLPPCTISVVDQDTFDAAIDLGGLSTGQTSTQPASSTSQSPISRVAVLNLASEKSPGGGWLNGALAQEECLCYRSSLYLSLHKSFYPLQSVSALYTPDVVIIRESFSQGHRLLVPRLDNTTLPVVSVISVAAIRRPDIDVVKVDLGNGKFSEYSVFARRADRVLTKDKMRISLRVAALKGHRKLVLGALGCGAFKNPTSVVADCWLEVLQESEFAGGWWEDIVFAVLDKGSDGDNAARDKKGNFIVFYDTLHGKVV